LRLPQDRGSFGSPALVLRGEPLRLLPELAELVHQAIAIDLQRTRLLMEALDARAQLLAFCAGLSLLNFGLSTHLRCPGHDRVELFLHEGAELLVVGQPLLHGIELGAQRLEGLPLSHFTGIVCHRARTVPALADSPGSIKLEV